MEEEKLSRADTKRLFIQELERYLLRISQKGDRLRKSSTKFSVARYSGLGSKIKLYLSNEQIYVRVFGRLQESSEHRMFLKDFSW